MSAPAIGSYFQGAASGVLVVVVRASGSQVTFKRPFGRVEKTMTISRFIANYEPVPAPAQEAPAE